MLAYIDVAVSAQPTLVLDWGMGQVAAALPQVVLLAMGLLACVVPALAQEPVEEPAQQQPDEPETIPVAEQPEQAPAKDAYQLDTIEVTASKRLKSQRDLPGSVGAVRGQDLEKMGAQGLSDYLKLVPGVTLADYGTGQQVAVIRGIASSTGELGTQFTAGTTGLFLEDMPFQDLYAPLSMPDLNPFDLERVEVLKGPQGTLFGSGALAGAIRYIVQKPELGLWQAKLSATQMQTEFADKPSRTGAAAVNIPLGDAAALRLVGLARDETGLYDARPNGNNTRNEDDIDRFDQSTGRALARWEPLDKLTLSAMWFGQRTDQYDVGSADNPDRPERRDVPFPSPWRAGFSGTNFTAAYDFAAARLLYSGNVLAKDSYSRSGQERSLPTTLGNQETTAWYNLIIADITGQAHELRLSSQAGDSPWEWLVGAAYMNYVQSIFQFSPNPDKADEGYYANPPEHPNDVAPEDRATSFLWATVDGDGTETALFGEATRRLGEYFELTLGARRFETDLVADTVLTGAQIVALGEPGQTEARTHSVAKDSGLNPKVSLRYLHDRNIQLYLLAAKGFQFGGFQLNPPIANIESATEAQGFHFGPYKSSELWNYEVGLRTEWLDRRVRFDLTAFYLDWKDLQLTVRIPINPQPIPAPPGSGVPENVDLGVIVNVAAAHSEGLEAAFEAVPFPGARFTSSAAWVDALTDEQFDEDNADGPVKAGTRLPGTPHFQWANVLTLEHELPYFSSFSGGFTLTHAHIGNSPNDLRPERQIGGYDTLDARLNLARPGAQYWPELTFGVNNLTDVRGISAYSGDGDAVNSFYFVRPRTTVLTLGWQM
jgi:iron complex outermembrane recepter protein